MVGYICPRVSRNPAARVLGSLVQLLPNVENVSIQMRYDKNGVILLIGRFKKTNFYQVLSDA